MKKRFEDLKKRIGRKIQEEKTESYINEVAEKFAESIKPKRLSTLMKHPKEFEARLDIFLKRLGLQDDEFEKHITDLLVNIKGMTPENLIRFVDKISVPKLRTYPDNQICDVAGQFVKWDPLIEFLCDSETQKNPDSEQKWVDLRAKLEGTISKRWPKTIKGYSAEDAVQDTIKSLIETADDPCRGAIPMRVAFILGYCLLQITGLKIKKGIRRSPNLRIHLMTQFQIHLTFLIAIGGHMKLLNMRT